MIQLKKKSAKHLNAAYNQMMIEMRRALDHNEPYEMTLQKTLDIAKLAVIEIGLVTAAEANEISEYIKRDVNDGAEYMMESSAEFYDWLTLDIELIERKVIETFLSVAELARIELERFKLSQSA